MTAPAAIKAPGSMPSGDLPFGPGTVLDGKYRLERVIGEGAMGRVWLARHLSLDLPVAIKVVEKDIHGPTAIARLMTEARSIAQLRHPNIVRVFDCQTTGRFAYAVMELLEGCTLADLMDEGPLPALLAVRLWLPLLDGLASVHRAGIVHRDIKPENVFIARAGDRLVPKLIDFGIAKHDALEPASKPRGKRGLIIGSPGYMAPEQATGDDDVDTRADLWAVAVVLYEAVSGESAFPAPTFRTFLHSLAARELTPLKAAGAAQLWPLLMPALAKDRSLRTSSCVEFACALADWLRRRGVREDLSSDSLPPLWAATGSPLHRALRRTRDLSRPSDPSAFARTNLQSQTGSGAVSVRRRGPSTIRTIPTHSGLRARSSWTALTLAAGALLGVFVAYGRLDTAQPHPALAADIVPLSAANAQDLELPEAASQRSEDALDDVNPPPAAPVRVHRAPRRSHLDPQRYQYRREAAALGLKSPW